MEKNLNLYLIVFFISFVIFIAGIVMLFIIYRNKQLLNLKEKQNLEEQFQKQLIATELDIQTQTMQDIGREIHDNVGQKLTLASLYNQQIQLEVTDAATQERLQQIGQTINESLQELRSLSRSLTDTNIATKDLSELLKELCEKINNASTSQVHFTTTQATSNLDYKQKLVLYRTVQEFIQNSLKHSQCKNINVSLENYQQKVALTLTDDGKGFDMNAIGDNGIGLNNIKQRIAAIGASYTFSSKLQYGTALNIQL
jgi:signal transduction histidine kinase